MNKEEWFDLKKGDLIISSSGRNIRKVYSNRRGCVSLLKLRSSWTESKFTVYTDTDSPKFEVYAKYEGRGILKRRLGFFKPAR